MYTSNFISYVLSGSDCLHQFDMDCVNEYSLAVFFDLQIANVFH
jgi:hypothetical protein